MVSPGSLLIISLLNCLLGAFLILVVGKNKKVSGWFAFYITCISSILALLASWKSLTAGIVMPETFLRVGKIFALTLHVDGLSAFFIILIASIAIPIVLYSIDYMSMYDEKKAKHYYSWLLIFIGALYGLVSTTDMMWFFFIFWQLMTIPGYMLIKFESDKPENRFAALKFMIMMQIACAITMIGAEILAGTASMVPCSSLYVPELKYDFASVTHRLPYLLDQYPVLTAFAFILFLCGFGIKLGMWPFGNIWLPDAHPAAPSPVSGMLSGVMIKTGVYGIIRYFLWLVPLEYRSDYPTLYWGSVIALLGTITLLTGTIGALKQHYTKRLLAYHSIGQVGYILFGIGVALMLLAPNNHRFDAIAVVAFAGALLHTLHHATFKSLLFLNAGAVLWRFRTQDINRLGGLLRWMPWTGSAAAIASLSISGVPGLNGFVSKWALYVAGIEGVEIVKWLPICTIIGIFTGALTLASFLKFYGAVFLNRTPDKIIEEAQKARTEVPFKMIIAQWALAIMCIGAGVLPAVTFGLIELSMKATHIGIGAVFGSISPTSPAVLAGVRVVGNGVIIGILVVIGLLIGMVVAYCISKLGGSKKRAVEPWLGGYVTYNDSYRFKAASFYRELKDAWGDTKKGK